MNPKRMTNKKNGIAFPKSTFEGPSSMEIDVKSSTKNSNPMKKHTYDLQKKTRHLIQKFFQNLWTFLSPIVRKCRAVRCSLENPESLNNLL